MNSRYHDYQNILEAPQYGSSSLEQASNDIELLGVKRDPSPFHHVRDQMTAVPGLVVCTSGNPNPASSEGRNHRDVESPAVIQEHDCRTTSHSTKHDSSEPPFNLTGWIRNHIKFAHFQPKDDEREQAWKHITKTVEKYSDELVEQWNKEIDGLLTFAGLFSAILSAFNVQSYQLLQPAASDQTNAILLQISSQLESFRISNAFLNSTQPAYNDLQQNSSAFRAPVYAIWVNTLWFVSLVFSLASATIGIIVKQWIKEYSNGLYGTSREIGRRRQYRLDCLERWHVAEIVAIIPLLLLIALVLFLAGLVILLYNLHPLVASVTTVFVGLTLAFVTLTTVLPAITQSCCYYSPQARAVFSVWHGTFHAVRFVVIVVLSIPLLIFYSLLRSDWSRDRLIVRVGEFLEGLIDKLMKMGLPVWRADEQAAYSSQSAQLDARTMVTAYSATLDTRIIDESISCLAGALEESSWGTYIDSLSDTVRHRGAFDLWLPKVLSTFIAWLLSGKHFFKSHPAEYVAQVLDNEISAFWNRPLSNTLIRLSALRSMRRQQNAGDADDVWNKHIFGGYMARIQDVATYRTVAGAAAQRLHEVAYDSDLHLIPSEPECCMGDWCLEFVYRHVNVIRRIIEHPQANCSPEWLPAVIPIIAHAFDSALTILRRLDMSTTHTAGRRYRAILEDIDELVSHERCGPTILTPSLTRSPIMIS